MQENKSGYFILVVLIFVLQFRVTFSQESKRENWKAYEFQGIEVWKFDSTNWDPNIYTMDIDDLFTIEDLRFELASGSEFYFVTFSMNGYNFYHQEPTLSVFNELFTNLVKDFGAPDNAQINELENFAKAGWLYENAKKIDLIYGMGIGEMELTLSYQWPVSENEELKKMFNIVFDKKFVPELKEREKRIDSYKKSNEK